MSMYRRCDTCGKEALATDTEAWYRLEQGFGASGPGFCTLDCVSGFVTARLLIGKDGEGKDGEH